MNKRIGVVFLCVVQGMMFAAESQDIVPKVLLINERKPAGKENTDVMVLHLNTEKNQIDTNSLSTGYYYVLSPGTFYDTQKDARVAPLRVLGHDGIVYETSLVNEDYAIVRVTSMASAAVPFTIKHEKVADKKQFEEAVAKCKKAGMKQSKFFEFLPVPSEEKQLEVRKNHR
jgi:hypothetical protein